MKKPFVVKTGRNEKLINFVIGLAGQAGYHTAYAENCSAKYHASVRFGENEGGGDSRVNFYDNNSSFPDCVIFDARTEMGKLLEFLEAIYIIEGSQKKEVVITKEGVTVGCVSIDAETAKKIANKIIEVMS